MKKLLFLLLTVMMGISSLTLSAQNTLTVADGTTTNGNVPVYGLYVDEYVRCQTIYPANEIAAAAVGYSMDGGSITGLTYYLSTPATALWGTAQFVVKIKEVTANTLSAFVDMSDAMTVYTDTLDGTQSTMTIPFTTPYTYQGGNLLIEVYSTQVGTWKSASFYGVSANGASWQGHSSSGWTAISGSAQNFIPKTTFTFTGGTEVTCSYVQNLAVDAAQTTTNSLTLTWTDAYNTGATYTVYDMADNTVIQSGITGTTFTVNNLAANTEYTFGVEANCSATDASVMMTASGRTACDAMSLPYTCGFEANEIQGTTNALALPWCSNRWVSTADYPNYPYSYSSSTYAHTGSRSLYFYSSTSTGYPDTMAFILPELDVNTYPMDGNRVTFWARSSSSTYNKTVYVGTLTNNADISTFALIDSVVVSGTTHVKYSVLLTNAAPTAPYIAFVVMASNDNLYIDDLTLEEIPSCLEVTDLSATNITSNSVTLNWVDQGNSGATYTIYDMSDTSTVATVTATSFTVDNLTGNTNYTFGVQANCSSGDAPITTVSALTACDYYELPFTENFSSTLSNDPCWRGATGVTAAEVFAGASLTLSGISAGYWNFSTSQNGFNDGHYYNNVYGSNRKAWMITPVIDLSAATTAQLSFDLALTAYSGTMQAPATYTGGQKFMVIVSTDGGNTWLESNATVWMNADSNANYAFEDIPYDHYGTYVINLNQYIGDTIKIAFYGESTVAGGDNNFHIDNIAVTEVPSCPNVLGLTLDGTTASTAEIHWNDNGADSYEVEVSQDGVVLTDVTVVVTDTTAMISGLTVNNDYQVTVRAICGGDNGQWTNPLNVHIGYCTPSPSSVDGNGITSVSFGGMTNTTHPTSAGFGDYTSMSGTVSAGLTATVEITYATGYTYGTLIWVDWDNSLSFEGNEVVYAGESTNDNPTTLAATFDIPATMPVGSYRMRIVGADMAFDNYTSSLAAAANADPCASYSWGVAEDYTLVVGDAPSCLPVTDLAVDTATDNSITISWTGTAASYDLYEGTTFVTNVTTTTYTFTGLSASSSYTFGVQAICSATDSANMVTINANTECGAITAYPYVQDFATAPSCWAILDADGDGQNWYLYQGAIQSASYNSGVLTPDNWLISPQFAIPATGNYEVTWSATAQDQSWPAEHYGVFISTTGYADTADYTMIQEWTLGTGVFNPVIDLSNYAGQNIYIALRHFNCTDQFRLSIDDFTVREQAGANQVTINVGQNNPAYGTVTGAGIYNIGDSVTVTATPAAGYAFSKWVDENNTQISTDNPYTFVAATDLTLNAIFLDNAGTTYTITVQVNDSTMGMATGAGTYTAGDQVTLSAIPFSGYNFVNWTQISSFGENVVGTDPSLTVTVTSDKTFKANFAAGSTPSTDSLTIHLTINDPTLGSINPVPGTYVVALNDSLVLLATPNVDVDFDGWRIMIAGQTIYTIPANPFVFTVSPQSLTFGELTFMAMFSDSTSVPDSMTVILNTADPTMGTTNPAPGIYHYAVGEESIITAVPNNGYHLLYWIETFTVAGITETDTLIADTISVIVPPMFAGVTFSITAYFEAGSSNPCETPTGLTYGAVTNESIAVSWDNADVASWNVRYRVQNGTWTSATVTTNSYTLTGLTENTTYQVQVQANCGDGNLSDWSQAITVTTTGINSWLENSVSLYPNPAKEYVDIRVDGDVNVTSMDVYDVYGKLINSMNVVENPTRINVSNLANGMYFVRVNTEAGAVTKTFVKK